MSDESKISSLEADDPIVLDARYKMDVHDRRKIDNQIVGTQRHVVDSLLSGYTATWGTLDPDSEDVEIGDCVVAKGNYVTKAIDPDLTSAGAVLGVAVTAATANSPVRYAIGGAISPEISGLTNGTATSAICTPSTAKIARTVGAPLDTDFVVGFVTTTGAVTINNRASAAITLVGGDASTATMSGTGSAGDVVCNAGDIADPKILTQATPAALKLAGNAAGFAIQDWTDGEIIKIAGPGTRVDISLGAPTSGKTTKVVVNSSALGELKDVPLAGDFIVGDADGTEGFVTVDPQPPRVHFLNPQDPRWGATGDSSEFDADALRDMIDAAEALTVPNVNSPNHPIQLAPASYLIDKPIHISKTNARVRGLYGSSYIEASSYVGPCLYLAPDYGEFPNTTITDWGKAAQFASDNRHCLRFSQSGEGWWVHGLSSLCIDIGVRVDSFGSPGAVYTIFCSSGGFYPTNDGAYGLFVRGNGAVAGTLMTSTGPKEVDSAAGALMDDGDLHHLRLRWESSTLKVFVDGVEVVSDAAGGTLVQTSTEVLVVGNGLVNELETQRILENADCSIAYIHMRKACPVGNTPPATKEDAVAEDSDSLFACDFETYDDVFVAARTRNKVHTAGDSTMQPAWFPHHDQQGGAIDGVEISDISFTNNDGPAIIVDSVVNAKINHCSGSVHQGILMYNNCYFLHVDHNHFSASRATRGIGFYVQNSTLSNYTGNWRLESFDVGIAAIYTDFDMGGRNYILCTQAPFRVIKTAWAFIHGEVNVSDEGTGGISGFSQRASEFISCANLHFAGWGGGYLTNATAPDAKCLFRFRGGYGAGIDDGNHLRVVLTSPWMAARGCNGYIELQDCVEGDLVRVVAPNRDGEDIPFLSTDSQADGLLFLEVDDGGAAAVDTAGVTVTRIRRADLTSSNALGFYEDTGGPYTELQLGDGTIDWIIPYVPTAGGFAVYVNNVLSGQIDENLVRADGVLGMFVTKNLFMGEPGDYTLNGKSNVIFVKNSTSVPSTSDTNGPIIYADSGALKARGTGGTVATLCAADPHCPICGRDFVIDQEHPERGEKITICLACLVDHLEEKGMDLAKFMINRTMLPREQVKAMIEQAALDSASRPVLEQSVVLSTPSSSANPSSSRVIKVKN